MIRDSFDVSYSAIHHMDGKQNHKLRGFNQSLKVVLVSIELLHCKS